MFRDRVGIGWMVSVGYFQRSSRRNSTLEWCARVKVSAGCSIGILRKANIISEETAGRFKRVLPGTELEITYTEKTFVHDTERLLTKAVQRFLETVKLELSSSEKSPITVDLVHSYINQACAFGGIRDRNHSVRD